jgi:transposase
MPAPLRVKLSLLEEETLKELQKASSVPYRTRNRAQMLKLNAQGKNVPEIAQIFNCHEHTVRAAIKRWEKNGLVGLWSTSGQGAKQKWKASDLEYIEACIKEEERTYNSVQLVQKLELERGVNLSSDRLRRILKKKDIVGKEPDTAIEKSPKGLALKD